jgi:ABC-type transporter Mla subunit MlaD
VQGSVQRLELQAGTATQRLELSTEQIEDQLSAATTELRASLEATNRVLDRLRDPRAALLGPTPAQLGPGEGPP